MRRCCILQVEERAFYLTSYVHWFWDVIRPTRCLLILQIAKPSNKQYKCTWENSVSAIDGYQGIHTFVHLLLHV